MKTSTFIRTIAAASILGALTSACGGDAGSASRAGDTGSPPQISVFGRGAEPVWWERIVEEAPTPGQREVVLPADVTFESKSAELSPDALTILADLAARIGDDADHIVIRAHTDSVGTEEDNLVLSERRGRAVLDALVVAGIPAAVLDIDAVGESEPRANEHGPDPDQARALNRRVEIVATITA